jgi:hypothetical protein
MTLHRLMRTTLLLGAMSGLAACGGGGFGSTGGLFNWGAPRESAAATQVTALPDAEIAQGTTLWDLFENSADPNVTVNVNKYIWNASLDILSFMPVESVDPFTGVIVMGYGTPPGGGRAYRATVYVQDPALDARSLNVALQSRGGGAVSVETSRAIEDAILTRARQLRVRDSNL